MVIVLNTLACGLADAKARRLRKEVSMTRAATMSSFSDSVANSAVASAVVLKITGWTCHSSQ